MARMARVVLPHHPHHITQRGNCRQNVFREEDDYLLYLELLGKYARQYELGIAGYCLMTNHIHVIGEPYQEDSIANTFKYCHGKFATAFNSKYGKSGHLWQCRPFSCVLDEAHAWAALRYVERNPVRARMVERAEDYRWSSARAHCGFGAEAILNSNWPRGGVPPDWACAAFRRFRRRRAADSRTYIHRTPMRRGEVRERTGDANGASTGN
jgi:putative transposase